MLVPGAGAGAVSWLCILWRQVAGAGAGCRCWCCELGVHVVETGCWCWVPGAGACAGAVSWLPVLVLAVRVMETSALLGAGAGALVARVLVPSAGPCCARGGNWVPVLGVVCVCVWWRLGAGAGCWCWLRVVEQGRCWVLVLAVRVAGTAPVPGAGAGCLRMLGTGCRCWVRVVETGCRCRVLAVGVVVLGAGAGCVRGRHKVPVLGAARPTWLRTLAFQSCGCGCWSFANNHMR